MPPVIAPVLVGVVATIATLLGGLLALRLGDRVVLLLGATAGVVLGVALFDLTPEALAIGFGWLTTRALAGWTAVGFGAYMLLGRLGRLPVAWRAQLGPAVLTLHSFLDGLGVGLAFQINARAGWLVALAVLTHDVADGVNTVSLSLAAQQKTAARRWLLLNGLAPLAGVLASLAVAIPSAALAPLLALFAGVFLYIGACELAPRSFAADPRPRTTLATLAGIALMYAVTGVAG